MDEPGSRPLRVLLAHRYYDPDLTTESRTLRLLGERLVSDGYDVAVYASQPNYNGVYRGPIGPGTTVEDGVTVRRIRVPTDAGKPGPIRLLNMLWYVVRLWLHIVTRPAAYDVVLVSNFPPVAMGVAARWGTGLRGGGYLIHLLDIYPEIAQHGGLMDDGIVARALRTVDAGNLRGAQRVVTLSEDMQATIASRGVATDHVRIINNMSLHDDHRDVEVPEELRPRPRRFRVVFAGNLGRFQGLEHAVDAMHLLADETDAEVELLFVGEGDARPDLAARGGALTGHRIRFVGHRPLHVALEAVSASDLALVSLVPGIIRLAYPSKLMTYLHAGCPVLAAVEADSDLARFVAEERLGVTCRPGSARAIADAIAGECSDEAPGYDRDRIRAVGEEHFGRERILSAWSDLFSQLARERGRAAGGARSTRA